ncbi:MAG: SDR family NAD(P)-dependent oxidoreductase [Armatimonadetes bacterium]|nr:SDR family NAD(P)-dependent oxidoreductase [Armatimonadota bacterium]
MSKFPWRKVIIVGATSGIGEQLVRLLVADGAQVAALGRRKECLERLHAELGPSLLPFEHDVLESDKVKSLFMRITQELGGLDCVIYSSGVMFDGRFDTSEDILTLRTNFEGCIAWMNEAALRFRGVGNGTLVAIGSVAGDRGRSGRPAYGASKAAVATYMESLRNGLSKQGITVVTIKPGPVETEMTRGSKFKNMMPARTAAELILRKSRKSGEHYLSPIHALVFAVLRHIPSPIFRRLPIE